MRVDSNRLHLFRFPTLVIKMKPAKVKVPLSLSFSSHEFSKERNFAKDFCVERNFAKDFCVHRQKKSLP